MTSSQYPITKPFFVNLSSPFLFQTAILLGRGSDLKRLELGAVLRVIWNNFIRLWTGLSFGGTAQFSAAYKHWILSIRELYTTLNQNLQESSPIWPGLGPNANSNISLSNLMLAFDMIANGNWAGPATNETALIRPVSFRDRLAAATLWLIKKINTDTR